MTAILRRAVYHQAYVVPSLGEAMPRWAARGVTWTAVESMTFVLGTPAGSGPVAPRITYSTTAPDGVYTELIEAVPGSVWALDPARAAHHYGIWSDDFAADHAELNAAGVPAVAWAQGRNGRPASFAYHRRADGSLIELVDSRSRPAFQRWLAGGRYQ